MDDADVSRFCCLSTACGDVGRRGAGNLSVRGRYGPHARRLLYCRTCKARFSERKGTPLFGSRLAEATAVSVLAHVADGCGQRATARLTGVSRSAVDRLGKRAGGHARALHDELVAFSPSDGRAAVR